MRSNASIATANATAAATATATATRWRLQKIFIIIMTILATKQCVEQATKWAVQCTERNLAKEPKACFKNKEIKFFVSVPLGNLSQSKAKFF